MATYNKNRNKVACSVCRARKTRCNGAKPECSFCQENGGVCRYESPQGPTVETNIEAILTKLSAIEERLGLGAQSPLIDAPESTREKGHPGFAALTIKENQFAAIVFHTDINLSTHARSLESHHAMEHDTSGSVAFFRHSPHDLGQLFFRHTYNWYPILNKREIFEKLPLMQNTVCTGGPGSFLLLMVLAIGGLNANDPIGIFQAGEFHRQALSMLGCVLEEVSLLSVQCVILLAIFYGLKVMPMKAQEYLSIGSIKMQNLMEIQPDNKSVDESGDVIYNLGEYETRAFWALFILESEYAGTLYFANTGLFSYANNMKFPSLREAPYPWSGSPESDSSGIDEPDPHFLAEIGVRKIIDRTCYTFNKSDPSTTGTTPFASIVAKELQSQLDEWYLCLPDSITFDKSTWPVTNTRHSTRALIRAQYFATVILMYWPCTMEIIMTGECQTQEHRDAFKTVIDSYIQLVLCGTSVRLSELPTAWPHAVSIFAMTATIIRMTQKTTLAYDRPEELESSIQHAFTFLESMVQSSPSIRYFTMILHELHNYRMNSD
ncbi:hypothetical protein PV08_04148 [Exophiala spinifera]|uniref:Zn(2)-C6 fungal-type domain-containing protein n=1 Tax=Exophiala spinifera TaxID=91928 RepID=A0A0D1ZWA5_9EURO|nr:uncharacterized protein PV08_04148 [Exophiala spinifera]KIW16957.1 hypothetical protein PV08_04148 [Exophiala spinifera]